MTRSIPTAFLLALAGAFIALQIGFGVLSLGQSSRPGASVVAMAMCAMLAVVVLTPVGRGLPRPIAVMVIVGVAAVTLLVQWGLPLDVWPNFAAWHLAAIQCLLIVVALRRRPLCAITGCTLFAVLTCWWSLNSVGGIALGLRMALAPVLFTLVAVALARWLSINDQRAVTQARQARELLDQAALADAEREHALSWGREVAELAGPSLRLAADPSAALTEDDRTRMLQVEASLRDRIRGGSLATPAVLSAVAEARRRGVTVSLLDDRGAPLAEDVVGGVTQALVGVVNGLHGGTLTIRVRPEQSAPPAVTIAHVPDDPATEAVYLEF